MDAPVRTTLDGDLAVQRVSQRYPLAAGIDVVLTPELDAWHCSVDGVEPAPPGEPGRSGAQELAHLLRFDTTPPVERFHLVRHVPAPEASGERPVDDAGDTVVVGERVVVAWTRTLRDIPYTAPITLAQLSAVDFLGVPDLHGVLIWTTPSGHEAPVAVVTKYLPRSTDGRAVLLSTLRRSLEAEPGETPPLTARMGRITAALHVALATRSRVLAEPVREATLEELDRWHRRVRATVDRAALIAAEGTVPGAGQAFLARLGSYEAEADALTAAADRPVLVQRVHGDLHVGRILRWAGGLMLTGFGDEPEDDESVLEPQPAVRDLARLLVSLESVAREVDESGAGGRCATEWLPGARSRVIAAYRAELAVAGRPELLDESLLAAFEAEYAAAAVIAAAHRAAPATP